MNNRIRVFCTVARLVLERADQRGKFSLNDALFTYDEFAHAYARMGFDHPIRKNVFNNYLLGHGSKKEPCKFIRSGFACETLGYFRLAAPEENGYDLDMVLTDETVENVGVYNDRKKLTGRLHRYFQWIIKTDRELQQSQMPELSSREAVYLAAAVIVYNTYYHTGPDDIGKYSFRQIDAAKLAHTYNEDKSVSACRTAISKRCTLGKGKHAYFSNYGGRKRLTFLRENDHAIPIIPNIGRVATVNGMKSIQVIRDFVRRVYNPTFYPTDEEWKKMEDKSRACFKIGDTFLHRNQDAILDYTIDHYCQNATNILSFLSNYKNVLQAAGLIEDGQMPVIDVNQFYTSLMARTDILNCGSDRFRKFSSRGRNAGEYIGRLQLEQFDGCEFSVAYLWENNLPLMRQIDLRSDEELYYYLMKFRGKYDSAIEIRFPGYPDIDIGNVDLENQVRSLMLQKAPIRRTDFISYYHNVYGIQKSAVVKLLKYIEPYRHGDVYQQEIVEQPAGVVDSGQNQTERRTVLEQLQNHQISLIREPISAEAKRPFRMQDESKPMGVLANRIHREFQQVDLVCEIEINNDEFQLLCDYLKDKYHDRVWYRVTGPSMDVILTVALVQIAIRYYDGNFWKYVQRVLGAQKLPANQQQWLGGIATTTLRKYGKAILNEHENAANILLHSFLTGSFIQKYFEYLFQYYEKDMERSVSEDCLSEADFICDCISNPYAKRQQFLSDYAGMSIYAARDYCQKIIAGSLKLIDETFWNQPIGDVMLPDRLYNQFLVWKDFSIFFREMKADSERSHGSVQKMFRKPHLYCDLNDTTFQIILPKQMLLMRDYGFPQVFWRVTGPNGQSEYPCSVRESYSGFRTEELSTDIDPKDIFADYTFELVDSDRTIRSFHWKHSVLQMFDLEGHWTDCRNLDTGDYVGFTLPGTHIEGEEVESSEMRNGLVFYHFLFAEGQILSVPNEANYYIGGLPESGLSREYRLDGVLFEEEDLRLPVYSRMPNLIIDVDEERFQGTALWINGTNRRLSGEQFVKITFGKTTDVHYYYLDISRFPEVRTGSNRITVDFPNSKRKFTVEFACLPGFSYSFEDAPYIYRGRGSLVTSYHLDPRGNIAVGEGKEDEVYNFDIDELPDPSKLTCRLSYGNSTASLLFDIPVLLYSWDGNDWSYTKPKDIWHADLKSILYLRYPESPVTFLVKDDRGYTNRFSYVRNADGIIVCDLTKLKSYLTGRDQILRTIWIQKGSEAVGLLNLVMRSYLHSADIYSDYNTGHLNARFDIAGKNDYYADVFFGSTLLAEKVPIEEGTHFSIEVPLKTGIYQVDVYEAEDGAGDFDDISYSKVDSRKVELHNPAQLTGSVLMPGSLIHVNNGRVLGRFELSHKYGNYIRLKEQIDRNTYIGQMISYFRMGSEGKNVQWVAIVQVRIPDLNDISQVTVEFYQMEYMEYEPFLYDRYANAVIQEENRTLKASERYRRYDPVLYADDGEDHYLWNVTYESTDKYLEKQADAWLKQGPPKRKKNVKSIWAE